MNMLQESDTVETQAEAKKTLRASDVILKTDKKGTRGLMMKEECRKPYYPFNHRL